MIKNHAERILGLSHGAGDPLKWYSNLHYLRVYYIIAEGESVWTGDIFKTDITDDPQKEYAIVITPVCDFAQKKAEQLKVVYGMKFKEISNYEPEGEENIPSVVKKIGKKDGHYRAKKDVLSMLFGLDKKLAEKFYVLYFLKESSDSDVYFHLLLDFQDLNSFKTIPSTWRKICRVDSPWIDDILQKYASLSSRIGTPDIPNDVRKAEKQKLRG